LLEFSSLINLSANHRRLQHRFTECCPGGRADQNVSPKFFGLSVSAILVVYHANVVAVRMFREIAHFSMIGALPVRARVKP
jgi:hypothetical protein